MDILRELNIRNRRTIPLHHSNNGNQNNKIFDLIDEYGYEYIDNRIMLQKILYRYIFILKYIANNPNIKEEEYGLKFEIECNNDNKDEIEIDKNIFYTNVKNLNNISDISVNYYVNIFSSYLYINKNNKSCPFKFKFRYDKYNKYKIFLEFEYEQINDRKNSEHLIVEQREILKYKKTRIEELTDIKIKESKIHYSINTNMDFSHKYYDYKDQAEREFLNSLEWKTKAVRLNEIGNITKIKSIIKVYLPIVNDDDLYEILCTNKYYDFFENIRKYNNNLSIEKFDKKYYDIIMERLNLFEIDKYNIYNYVILDDNYSIKKSLPMEVYTPIEEIFGGEI